LSIWRQNPNWLGLSIFFSPFWVLTSIHLFLLFQYLRKRRLQDFIRYQLIFVLRWIRECHLLKKWIWFLSDQRKDELLGFFNVDIVVELNNISSFAVIQVYVIDYLHKYLLVLWVNLLVLINDLLELDFFICTAVLVNVLLKDLASRVKTTEKYLIKISFNKHFRICD